MPRVPGEASMDRIEQGFAATALTSYFILIGLMTYFAVT